MARVDICYDNMSGIYVDHKWVTVEYIDVSRVDHPGEKVYEFGSSTPVMVIEDPRIEWTVRLDMTGPIGPTMNMTIHDAEIHFWAKRQEYVYHQEMYVIQEMYP